MSTKLVFTVLDEEGPLTQQQIIDRTLLPPRTTRYAVSELKEAALIEEDLYIPDVRKTLYRSHPGRDPTNWSSSIHIGAERPPCMGRSPEVEPLSVRQRGRLGALLPGSHIVFIFIMR